ncbi:hypothetical protein IJE86_11645 [bacterium]|nr:hypothetical protein [bacterium]
MGTKVITNFDKFLSIKDVRIAAELISGKYACSYCAYRGSRCEMNYTDGSCSNGIEEFLKREYKPKVQ